MCSECTKIRKKRYLLLHVLYEKKKRHNNRSQTINTKIGIGLY